VGLAAYAVAVFQRASLGVAGVEAQRRFTTTAAVLALFAVLQLAVYAALQIPVGVLLDRIGSRRAIAAGAFLMGIGQLVLATAHAVGLAVAGRALVGVAWREPGTRLGLWTHFVTQFSGTVFALLWGYPFLVVGEHPRRRRPASSSPCVVAAMGIGPTLGHFAGRWPYRRSLPVLVIVATWTVVLVWPGRAPLSLLVVLSSCSRPTVRAR
jgi:MFS family permease